MNRVAACIVLAVWLITPIGTLAASLPAEGKEVCTCPTHTDSDTGPENTGHTKAAKTHPHGHRPHGEHAHGQQQEASNAPQHVHKLPNGPIYAPCEDEAQAGMALAPFLPGTPVSFTHADWFDLQALSTNTFSLRGRSPTPEPRPPRPTV